jgi:hypothetical protein
MLSRAYNTQRPAPALPKNLENMAETLLAHSADDCTWKRASCQSSAR